jgi:hypothetical protein
MTLISKLTTRKARRQTTHKPGVSAYRAVAEMAGSLQRYQDIPLRFQKQWIASFLTVTVLVGLVAGLYLNVTASAAIAGREIQGLEAEIVANERFNADLQTQIATLLANETLEQRALALGYVHLERTDLEYLVVPGYFKQPGVKMVSPVANTDILSMSPEFSESLLDWIARQIETASVPLAQTR